MATMELLISLSIGIGNPALATENPSLKIHSQEKSEISPHKLIYTNHTQQFEIAQHLARTQHDGCERIIRNGNRQSGFFADALVQVLK
jgi:hypothetical protein